MLPIVATFALSALLAPGRPPVHAFQRHAYARMNEHSLRAPSRRELVVQAGALAAAASSASVSAAEGAYPKISMTTTAGTMEFELWDDVAPGHVKNMLTLAKQGFFDGGAFHRIIPGFVVQVWCCSHLLITPHFAPTRYW
eukprot:scaffold120756_cov33-Tisochrysis_lutea.AAC.3